MKKQKFTLNPPGTIVHLSPAEEWEMCRYVAMLEIAGDTLAAGLLRELYDVDDVWIWEIREKLTRLA